MKAAVIEKFNAPLALLDVDEPRIGADDVLVRVRACGLCGTDLKIAAGRFPEIKLPHIPGHEIAGEVQAVGDGVKQVQPGDRVVVYIYINCGRCRYCLTGRDSLCENLNGRVGFTVYGGMAEWVKVPATNVLPFGEHLEFSKAAALPDAVATVYHALCRRGAVEKDDIVVVVGAGGLGLHAVQIAKSLGARVIAVDIKDSHLEKALLLGAETALNPERENVLDIVRKNSEDRGAEVVIDLVGQAETLSPEIEWLCPGGKLLVVGYNLTHPFAVSSHRMIRNEIDILGCRAMTRQDLADVISWTEAGRISPIVDDILPLDAVNEAYERLKKGETVGRLVLEP